VWQSPAASWRVRSPNWCETPLLFHHSRRVYYFGALAGKHRGPKFDPELLYAGAMFHDMGLTRRHKSTTERFEVIAETSL
jgi:HD superfamily phosphodiesterase